jgi:prolyl-tRNA editing enzyme YbaK/EbsC (Cys-tRNA(Pro) deacylase)
MHPSAQRVQTALQESGYDGKVVELIDSTRTAVEAAQAAGCEVGQIAKSLIFRLEPTLEPVLILVSGSNRVHEKRLGRLLGGKLVRPDASYVRDVTGFAIGGIPPIGHKTSLKTYLDEDLLQYETVWGAAGTPNAVFEITPQELVKISNSQVVCVK